MRRVALSLTVVFLVACEKHAARTPAVVSARAVSEIVYVDPISERGVLNDVALKAKLIEQNVCNGVPVRYFPVPLRALSTGDLDNLALRDGALVLAASGEIFRAIRAKYPLVAIVFQTHGDPTVGGLVDSLNAPGKNASGITFEAHIDGKRLELLRDALPTAKRLLIITDESHLTDSLSDVLSSSEVRALGFSVRVLRPLSASDVERELRSNAFDAAYVPYAIPAFVYGREIAQLLRGYQIPTMYDRVSFLDDGGMLAYDAVSADGLAALARYAGLACSGVAVGSIPIERSRITVLGLNLEVVRQLNVRLSPGFLRLVDVRRP